MDIESVFGLPKDVVLFDILPNYFVIFILVGFIIMRARAKFNRLRRSAGIGQLEKNTSQAKTEKLSDTDQILPPEIIIDTKQENENKATSSQFASGTKIAGFIAQFVIFMILCFILILVFSVLSFLPFPSSDELFAPIFVFGLFFLVGFFALLNSSIKDRYMSFIIFGAIVLIIFLIIVAVGLYELLGEISMNYHGGGFAP